MASLLLLTLGGEKGGGGGGGGDGGSTDGQLSCPEGSNYAGSTALIGSSAALLGAVACVDTAAIAYRETLDASIAGTDTSTVNLYGPFEAGFTDAVPGLSCLGSNTVDGGLDTFTAQLMVQDLCNDDSIALLQTCGDHANPRHFHEHVQRDEPATGPAHLAC